MPQQLTATCSAGLEDLVAAEVATFGGREIETLSGAVTFKGDLSVAYRACLWSRFASRILLFLSRFPAPDPEKLYEGVRNVAWKKHMHAENTLAVDCVLTDSTIKHSHFAALKVKDAVVDYFRDMVGHRPSVDSAKPDIRINLFLRKDEALLSLDLSGTSLHRRGYRHDTGTAPLKESLAAAIVTRAGVDCNLGRDDVVLDPLCGSGTLLIESALIIGDIAPGFDRHHFGFLNWRAHNKGLWQDLVDEALARENKGADKAWPRLLGFDSDPGVVKAALANIDRAGLSNRIHVERRDLARLQPPGNIKKGRHIMITNPPYGERLSEKDEVKYLYRCLGRIAAGSFQNWHMAVFSSNPDLLDALAKQTLAQYRFYNGPLPCTLRLFEVHPQQNTPTNWQINSNAAPSALVNRLKKNLKPLLKWACREKISCLRIYDRDIPEFNVSVDLYGPWVGIYEYPAPATITDDKVRARRREVLTAVSEVLDCKRSRIFIKSRNANKAPKSKGKNPPKAKLIEVEEGGCRFLVNLSNYSDSGLFLGHRCLRRQIQDLAADKRFLHLFCSSGAATVHAAMGGARSSTSVDTSQFFVDWARKNLVLNGFDPEQHKLVTADCLKWLQKLKVEKYDLIYMDPPSFSTPRKGRPFDIQQNHVPLIKEAMRVLSENGLLLFSTTARNFKIDQGLKKAFIVDDIARKTLPQDFSRQTKTHHVFEIRHTL